MTRVLWHYSMLNLGGAELSTLRLLDGLRRRGVLPVLALNVPGGAAEPLVDPAIDVRHLRPAASEGGSQPRRRVAGAMTAARFAFAERFDAAVVGLQGLSPTFACRVVRARRRLHFIRNDIAACDAEGRIAARIRRTQRLVDAYVCVSEAARRSLLACDPALEAKAHTIHNLLGAERLRAIDETPRPFAASGRLQVVTVARLSERAKGLTRMVAVHAALLRQGIDVDWHVVGEGPDRPLLERAIAAAGTGGRMHLAGCRTDPRPFYRHADLVAVLSHYEGLSGAINEAKILGRPVIATDVGGAREQLDPGGGLVVAPTQEAITAGMALMLGDEALRARMAKTPLPAAILDDETKLDRLVALLMGEAAAPRRRAGTAEP